MVTVGVLQSTYIVPSAEWTQDERTLLIQRAEYLEEVGPVDQDRAGCISALTNASPVVLEVIRQEILRACGINPRYDS
ncbi:MAG: hypothetical protein KW802_01100 [Candidatus Doudnabacteria bacterium]|nr:hypothetical protein [Candidatus Doudnabacteria bacterium]